MSNSRATRKVDDFWVQFLTKGDARPVEIEVPEDDPFKEIMNSISASVLQFLASAVEGTDVAALLRPDRVIVPYDPAS